jgi:hypothetical protein
MRVFFLFFLINVGLLCGCAAPIDPNLQSPSVQNSNATGGCSVWETICNDIYMPVTCTADGLSAAGANSCDGENRVRVLACEHGMAAAQIQNLSFRCN